MACDTMVEIKGQGGISPNYILPLVLRLSRPIGIGFFVEHGRPSRLVLRFHNTEQSLQDCLHESWSRTIFFNMLGMLYPARGELGKNRPTKCCHVLQLGV